MEISVSSARGMGCVGSWVALIGSVAYGTATEDSDLDIFVLGEKDKFVNKETEGICVEIHYSKMETAMKKLRENPILALFYKEKIVVGDKEC